MMQNSLLSKIARRMIQRGQTGQTIVILAFGFIVLLCFVGIVTDVSLLFVRYSTLRRATDAAAVAAAGQMRRSVPTAAEITRATTNCGPTQVNIDDCAYGYSFARNLTNVNLAARQFIEFYGLAPTNIVVNTCATTAKNPADAIANNKVFDADLECDDTQQPRKLVRVIAQIESPTVFLRLIGWGTITLEASAISETAVLDVVMIFDASESMLNQTTYKEWEDINKPVRYLPPRVTSAPMISDKTKALYQTWAAANHATLGPSYTLAWRTLLNRTQAQINADNNRITGIPVIGFKETSLGSNTWAEVSPSDPLNTRQECRVRFFPGAGAVSPVPDGDPARGFVPTDDVRQEYTKFLKDIGVFAAADNYPSQYDGFIPAYNFYGCCNDPDGLNGFGDLICQPFRKVRDATEKFLDRIDFIRGDRVAFVTFDRAAFLIDPDGTTGPELPMMTDQGQALTALRNLVGVRAEPSYYADTDCNGRWDSYVTGGSSFQTDCINPVSTTGGIPIDYSRTFNRATNSWGAPGTGGFDYTSSGNLADYPVKDNCFLQNIALPFPLSLYSSPVSTDAATGATYIASRYPTSFAALYFDNGSLSNQSYMNPNLNNAAWDTAMQARYPNNAASVPPQLPRQTSKALFSYEFRAGCGGSNVGAALRVGSGALLDPRTVRLSTSGGVWVMVMLGDGAAGGTDPVVRNNTRINPGNPYGSGPNSPLAIGTRGEYGSYGLCPYGAPDNLGALVDNNSTGTVFNPNQPRCMDPYTYTRQQCPSAAPNADVGNGNIDIATAGCSVYYDADDFARDWADYIALSELPNASPFLKPDGSNRLRSDIKLPTIFTIGFGLDFNASPGSCSANIPDCLGEELLRYIADVGDNNRIDTDYQQDTVFDGVINGVTADGDAAVLGSGAFGDRGECETATIASYTPANLTNSALPPKQNCGNYFNAPDEDGLNKVFDEIASRMFTRITR